MKTLFTLTFSLFCFISPFFSQLDDLDFEPRKPLFKRNNTFEQGLMVTGSFGWKKNHMSLNGELGYRFPQGFEVTLGTGIHANQLLLPVNNSEENISVTSTPFYLSGKYFFVKGWVMPYAKLALGYGKNNMTTIDNTEINNSFMLEAGLGLSLKSNRLTNYFFEVGQYNLKTQGSLTSLNGGSAINYDVWFNRIIFRVGVTRYLFKI